MKSENKALLKNTFKKIETYLENIDSHKVVINKSPNELKNLIDISISDDGISNSELENKIDTYLKYSVHSSSKQYSNQLFAGTNLPSLLGEYITATVNTSNYTFEVSPLGSIMERELVAHMSSKIGYSTGGGTFVTGGSNANLMALLCARQKKFPDVKTNGIGSIGITTLFVSDRCHYSFEKAANVLGIGIKNLRKVKSNSKGEMIPQELEKEINLSIEAGEKPFFVAATSGTTELGAFDPIIEIHKISEKYDLWLHIDGAWGGSILLSNKHKHLLAGSELSDSFTWDAHKMMNIPLICSAFLIKDEIHLKNATYTANSSYIFRKNEYDEFDIGNYSIQCAKKVDSFKLWLAWKYYGDKGYDKRISYLFELSQYATEYINNHPRLELMADTISLNVNFRITSNLTNSECYNNLNINELNDYNLAIREKLVLNGNSVCNYCFINGNISFRLITNNPDKSFSDIDKFFDNLFEAEKQLEKECVDEFN